MKNKLLFFAAALLTLSSCGIKSQPFVAYIRSSGIAIASDGEKVIYLTGTAKHLTNFVYDRAFSGEGKLLILRGDKLFQVEYDGTRLALQPFHEGTCAAFSGGKVYVKYRNQITVINGEAAVGSYLLEGKPEEMGVWNDTFFVCRSGSTLTVYQRIAEGMSMLTERFKIDNVADFAVGGVSPVLIYVKKDAKEVISQNLYSGELQTLATLPTPIRKLRYYDGDLLILICGDSIAFQHLDSSKLEVGALPFSDACFDPDGRRVFALDKRGMTVVDNVGSIVTQTNSVTTLYSFR